MARLGALERGDLPAEEQDNYDAIVASRGKIQGPFTVLIHSPDLAKRIADVGAYIRFESPLPVAVRCFAAVMVAREMDCAFEWAGWVPQARDAGVPDEAIQALRERRAPSGLSEELQLVYTFGRQLLSAGHRVDDSTYQAVTDHFGVPGTVELTATFGYLAMLSFSLNAFQVDPPEGRPLLES